MSSGEKKQQGHQLSEIWRKIFALPCAAQYDPWIHTYCGYLADEQSAHRFLSYIRYPLDLGRVAPSPSIKILDVGCGFGPVCLGFWIFGFRQIYGLDIYGPMINTANVFLRELNLDNAIRLIQGDAARLSEFYDTDFFDVVFCNEGISHFRHYQKFLEESHKVLKPGGLLIISDNNNGANPFMRRKNYEIWRAFENAPDGTKIYGHTVKASYFSIRRDIIREHFPEINQEEVERLARGTSGMDVHEIKTACERYVTNGEMPTHYFVPTQCPLNPRTGIYIENMLQPYNLASALRTIGFTPRVSAYLCGAGRGGIFLKINAVWKALSRLTIYLSRGYRIVAEK